MFPLKGSLTKYLFIVVLMGFSWELKLYAEGCEIDPYIHTGVGLQALKLQSLNLCVH